MRKQQGHRFARRTLAECEKEDQLTQFAPQDYYEDKFLKTVMARKKANQQELLNQLNITNEGKEQISHHSDESLEREKILTDNQVFRL